VVGVQYAKGPSREEERDYYRNGVDGAGKS
jgi:hypothetical protein